MAAPKEDRLTSFFFPEYAEVHNENGDDLGSAATAEVGEEEAPQGVLTPKSPNVLSPAEMAFSLAQGRGAGKAVDVDKHRKWITKDTTDEGQADTVHSKVKPFIIRGDVGLARISLNQHPEAARDREFLYLVCKKGDKPMLELLLDYGASVNAPFCPRHGASFHPLAVAVEHGQEEIVRCLLERGADTDVSRYAQRSPLHVAALAGNVAVAKLLLDGASTAQRGADGETPLHCAATEGYVDMARLLLDRGADPNLTDNDSRTPLHLAAMETTPLTASAPFFSGASRGSIAVADLLLIRNANVRAVDALGRTPLHYAVTKRKGQMVELLLAGGALPHARDSHGEYPLHRAARIGNDHCAQLLLQAGAEVDARDFQQATPLHKAARTGSVAVVNLLLIWGARPEAENNNGKTPLRMAEKHASEGVIMLLRDPTKVHEPSDYAAVRRSTFACACFGAP
uniref:Uncharacterized protein n=1 Tax=Phaeomonas parva TaxID=124430 RepID=A0A7S1XVD9_9STRA